MPYKKFFEGGGEHENLEALARLLTDPTKKYYGDTLKLYYSRRKRGFTGRQFSMSSTKTEKKNSRKKLMTSIGE